MIPVLLKARTRQRGWAWVGGMMDGSSTSMHTLFLSTEPPRKNVSLLFVTANNEDVGGDVWARGEDGVSGRGAAFRDSGALLWIMIIMEHTVQVNSE